jgi:DNA-binding response OmpR family regulator
MSAERFSVRQMLTTPEELSRTEVPAAIAEAERPRATVLLAEDDRSLRRYLEVTLRRAGYAVITAADGLEAMKAALSSPVDAVITDAVMPHLSGQELCRFLHGHPTLGRLPVVLLSGADETERPHDARASADAYLSKPVRPEELSACISRLLAADAG